ncbi:GTP-binding protein Rhes-like [Micropterus dolomieu]|uniref:GTP-binding protein Rhes-like n=1 Tax=Micropterus dolomieu TaxID=147949 RepID=UPI001E8D22F2|nr:GTP-binding protein Rhes-like [Micropterus dolomieu]
MALRTEEGERERERVSCGEQRWPAYKRASNKTNKCLKRRPESLASPVGTRFCLLAPNHTDQVSMPLSGRPNTVRLVFLGAAKVGKSALICRYLHDRFEHKYTRTVEELYVLEYDTAGSGKMRLEILDTSGSYSFPAMRELCIRHSDAFALVYAVDDPGSLEEVRRLRDEILELRGDKGAPITVVGNKADLTETEGRVLLAADVMATVEGEWDANFVEASARTGGNTLGVFRALLQQVNLPHRLSPTVCKRRDTLPRPAVKKRPPLQKNNSCVLS